MIALVSTLTLDGPATIDLSRVTYADSTVFSILAAVQIKFQEVPVTLVGPQPNILRVLRMVSFDKLFRITDGDGS